MGTRFRVIVERIDDVEGAQYETRETLMFEATLPRAARLLSFAPDEVRAALMEAAMIEEGEAFPQRVMQGVAEADEPQPMTLGTDTTPAAGSEPETVAAPPKQRKPRRTKAQIAADEEAARAAGERMQAAVNGAAVQHEQVAEAMALPAAVPAVEDVTSIAHSNVVVETVPQPAPVSPAAPLTEPAPTTPAAELLAPPLPTADGEVWNPFKR